VNKPAQLTTNRTATVPDYARRLIITKGDILERTVILRKLLVRQIMQLEGGGSAMHPMWGPQGYADQDPVLAVGGEGWSRAGGVLAQPAAMEVRVWNEACVVWAGVRQEVWVLQAGSSSCSLGCACLPASAALPHHV
jgi:hypothetical protein